MGHVITEHSHEFTNGIYHELWTARDRTTGTRGCIIHGLGEHSGRYGRTVGRLLESPGIQSIRLFDLPGHGKSEGRRGDGPGGFDGYMDVVDQMFYAHPDIEWVWGHSMGSLVFFKYLESCKKTPGKLNAVVMSAPPFEIVHKPNFLQKMALPLLNKTVSFLTLPTGLKAEQISSLPDEQELYAGDERVHDKISVRIYEGMLKGGEDYLDRFFDVYARHALRVFVAFGGDDTVASPDVCGEIKTRLRDQGIEMQKRVQIKTYEGSRHEIHHDARRKEFLSDVVTWVTGRRPEEDEEISSSESEELGG